MKPRLKVLSSAFLLALFASLAVSQTGKYPVNWKGLPEPFHTPSASNRPQVISRPEDADLRVPAGFQVEEYMAGFDNRPRFMQLGPSNEILLTDSGGAAQPNWVALHP